MSIELNIKRGRETKWAISVSLRFLTLWSDCRICQNPQHDFNIVYVDFALIFHLLNVVLLCLLLPICLIFFPSKIILVSTTCRIKCPIIFPRLFSIVSINHLISLIISNSSLFVLFYVQLILFILFHTYHTTVQMLQASRSLWLSTSHNDTVQ